MTYLIHPVSYPYHGVQIERPCANCGTVNVHTHGGNDDCPEYRPKALVPTPEDNAFPVLVAMAKHLGQPRHYTSDLFRDYERLERTRSAYFLWGVRSTGTDLIPLDQPPGEINPWRSFDLIVDAGFENTWFLYRDGRLTLVSLSLARCFARHPANNRDKSLEEARNY